MVGFHDLGDGQEGGGGEAVLKRQGWVTYAWDDGEGDGSGFRADDGGHVLRELRGEDEVGERRIEPGCGCCWEGHMERYGGIVQGQMRDSDHPVIRVANLTRIDHLEPGQIRG